MTSLRPDEYYMEGGLFVLTERYHLRRGTCCGNGCRHCPYEHAAVLAVRRAQLPPPRPYFPPAGAPQGDAWA